MKRKKINRGVMLLLVLLVGIVGYLVVRGVVKASVKNELEELYVSYLTAEQPFHLHAADKEEEAWTKECEQTLTPYFSKESTETKAFLKTLKGNRAIQREMGESLQLKAYSKKFLSCESMELEEDYARLSFWMEVSWTEREARYTSQRYVSALFCKEDGKWKISRPDGYTWNTNGYEDGNDYRYMQNNPAKGGYDV
ncbi:MAG TPA: hypothetical protein DER23_08835 [Clostridiales bacterium]|jgi:hypothetical protein|nr:hypothetical protein [Clostridiales bacterium]HCG36435.1 hypothetical protein [Clostridiales bacterium]